MSSTSIGGPSLPRWVNMKRPTTEKLRFGGKVVGETFCSEGGGRFLVLEGNQWTSGYL